MSVNIMNPLRSLKQLNGCNTSDDSSVDIPPEFSVIFTSFYFTGVNLSTDRLCSGKRECLTVLKKVLLSVPEIWFMTFSIFSLHLTFKMAEHESVAVNVSSLALNACLMLLRVSLFRKRGELRQALLKLSRFADCREARTSPYLKYARLSCFLCYVVPLVFIVSTFYIGYRDPDQVARMYRTIFGNGSSDGRTELFCEVVFAFAQTTYLLNFITMPGLTMALLSLMYLQFVCALQRRFASMRKHLLDNFSADNVSRALLVLDWARGVYNAVEGAVSFAAFLVYVLTFECILHLISIYSSDFMSHAETLKTAHAVFAFLWFVSGFSSLTVCASRIAGAGQFLEDLTLEVVSRNFASGSGRGGDVVGRMQVFLSAAKFDVLFTGWGMFPVEKNLFLTIAGVLATYSVFFSGK